MAHSLPLAFCLLMLGTLLPRAERELREPLVRRQGSQVSMRVARGSASARGSSVPSIRRQNASGRLWAKAPMVGGGAGFVVYSEDYRSA